MDLPGPGAAQARNVRAMSMREKAGRFRCQDRELAYRVYGEGPRATVLLHGLLLSQRMHEPLARALAEHGNRVVTLDLLGHGLSDRPPDMWRYSMGIFAHEVVGLLDHLGVEEAVVGGTSLGANVDARGGVAALPSGCAGWSWRCPCSTTRCWRAPSRSRP